MIKKNIIRAIANKEMDRGEFLKYSGLVLLSLIGFGALLNTVDRFDLISKKAKDDKRGFGGGRYGV